jgi:hypothetical protein
MSSIYYSAPSASTGIQSLLGAVAEAGFDKQSLRRLLWQINAHSSLISHAQVFTHLQAHFSSPTFSQTNLDWARDWKEDVPHWAAVCAWIGTNTLQLTNLPGLEHFAYHLPQRHPIMRKGISRHAVVSGIWNRHEDAPSYPPVHSSQAANAYFLLQGHLLAAFMESRHRSSTVETYWEYAGVAEMPRAPIRTARVGLAIRIFSLASYTNLLKRLPLTFRTQDYASQLTSLRISTAEVPSECQERAHKYFATVSRYFALFLEQLLHGWSPNQSQRLRMGGGSGSGGYAHQHGFIHLKGISGVYIDPSPPEEEDPDTDTPRLPGKRYSFSSSANEAEIEECGEAPREFLNCFFPLMFDKVQDMTLYRERLQKAAIESAAQNLRFAYQRLTPEEAHITNRHCCVDIEKLLSCATPPPEDTHVRGTRGLLIRLMLCLGQPVEAALATKLVTVTDISEITEVTNSGISLVVQRTGDAPLNHTSVLGFLLPAISPQYKTELPSALSEANSPTTTSFLLPDYLGTGRQLLQYLDHFGLTQFDSFGTDSGSIKKSILDLAKELSLSRVTPTKLSRFLEHTLIDQTGDQTLAWMLTSNERRCNEPRMFYTRYRVSHLIDAYRKSCKRLARTFGTPIASPPIQLSRREYEWVGARFVAQFKVVQTTIADLQDLVAQRHRDRSMHEMRNYHQRYLIYTILYQSLLTAYRANNNPSQVYLAWKKAQPNDGLLIAGLADKESAHFEHARLTSILQPLGEQYENFSQHTAYLPTLFPSIVLSPMREGPNDILSPFFTLTPRSFQPDIVSVSWISRALRAISGVPLPANFQRAFLRTALLDFGCPPEVIDAFHGHANQGELPFASLSTFDYFQYIQTINKYLLLIHDELGLRPIYTRLIPPAIRSNFA